MLLSDRNWTRQELLDRIGRLSQLGGITRYEYVEGKAKGVSALSVRTAAGLVFEVIPDKCLDIVAASYLGKSLSWHSPVGIVHPAFYDSHGIQWVKTFAGGLLTTCGFYSAGFPTNDNGEELGLHGAASNIPAEHVSWNEQWEGDECTLTITGTVRETWVHGPNLLLTRTYSVPLNGSAISVRDRVENQGMRETPLMVLYHLNFGFPLLSDQSRIYAPSQDVEPLNQYAEASIKDWSRFEAPVRGIEERVYFHHMKADERGRVTVLIVTDDARHDFGIAITYSIRSLPHFIEWKMTGTNHFVLGLEPANCRVLGRTAERQAGRVKLLQPGESEDFSIDFRVLSDRLEITEALKVCGL
jgi:galactose mutarotase-like enzyme